MKDNDTDVLIPSITPNEPVLSGWRFKALIFTIIISVIGYFLFSLWGGWQDVLAAVKAVGFKGMTVALLLSLANYGLRFLRWHHYLTILGYPHVPWLSSLRIYMAGFSLTTTPGKTGEALRSIFLHGHGIPYRKSLGAFFAERVSDLIAVVILSFCGFWAYSEGRLAMILVGSVIAFVILVIQKQSWLLAIEKLVRRLLPERFAHRIEFLIEMIIAFRVCYSPLSLTYGIVFGVTAWACEGVGFYYLLQLLDTPVDMLSAQFIYAFSLMIGAISFLPGGLGGVEVTMWQLLMLYGVPKSPAIAVTIVIRLATLWFSVIIGLFCLPQKPLKNK